ncbi:MAG TPA: AMP-binding protein [Thermomicrobiales bacterium]|nr:AMP-binding protein [Thermomicrobiales bacterium]
MSDETLSRTLATSAAEAVTGIAWEPDRSTLERSRLQRLIKHTGAGSYELLLERIAGDPGWYWQVALDDLDLAWQRVPDRIWNLERGPAWPEWFPGGAFNLTQSALDRWVGDGEGDRVAVIAERDDGTVERRTFRELLDETVRVASGLRAAGVKPGDRVGVLMPMVSETVVAMLALARIQAVSVPLFSGYGEDAIVTRLADSGATALITVDAFQRRGKEVPLKRIADRALTHVPAVACCVVVRHERVECDMTQGRDVWWDDLADVASPERAVPETPADTPCMIMYTSGTTGRPKGAVHTHAGFPIKATHDLTYCFDLHKDDVLFWLTDLGWMMGPWLIFGGLMRGATVVLLEGTPDYPGAGRLWEMVERHRISVLGLAPTAVRALIPAGTGPVEATDRSSLRILGSTGETWNPDPWWWLFDIVGQRRCPIINYSGGTETSGGIVSSVPILPQRACSFNGPVPGMVADVVDDSGASLERGVGELVVRAPWVGMTNGFWNDPGRYEETYWSRFPGTWVHGDWAEVDNDGFWYIRGRSDDTMNIAGKRVGPAEIESAVVAGGSVREAAAVSIPHPVKGSAIAVVAVLQPGIEDSGELRSAIRDVVAERLGRSFRPEQVVCVDALPRTRNAKIMRRMIRSAWLGENPGDSSALENPEAVDAIRRAARDAARG